MCAPAKAGVQSGNDRERPYSTSSPRTRSGVPLEAKSVDAQKSWIPGQARDDEGRKEPIAMCTPAKAGAQNSDTNLALLRTGPRLSPGFMKGRSPPQSRY